VTTLRRVLDRVLDPQTSATRRMDPPPAGHSRAVLLADTLLQAIRARCSTRPGTVARHLVAGVLFFAALQKLFATSGAIGPLWQAVLAWELLLVVWLSIGFAAVSSWYATLFTLAAFTGYTVAMMGQGASSCGCLGDLIVPPAWLFLLDLSLLALVLWGRNTWGSSRTSRPPLLGSLLFVATAAGLLFALSLGAAGVSDRHLSSAYVGQSLPLLPNISIDVNMRRGAWDVIVFSLDCPKCLLYLDRFPFVDYKSQLPRRVAFISIGHSPPVALPHLQFDGAYHGWIRELPHGIAIPFHVRLQDGIVVEVVRT
jgi:hypothetical protein